MSKDPEIPLPKGITMHRGKLRIAFRPKGFKNQVKRVLDMAVTKSNIKVAEMKLNAIRHEILLGTFDIGRHFPNDPLSRTSEYTVAEMLTEFMAHITNVLRLKPSTLNQRAINCAFLTRAVGKVNVRGISRPDVIDLRKKLRSFKGDSTSQLNVSVRSAAEVNKLIAVLCRAADVAVDHHMIDVNPFRFLKPLAEAKADVAEAEDGVVEVMTIANATRVLGALPEGFTRNVMQFLFWSGARHGEALALEKRDLDLPYVTIRRTLTVDANVTQTPKTGGARKILLPSKAVEAIVNQLPLAKGERIFERPNRRGKMNSNSIPKVAWRKALTELGLPYMRPYVTRHSFVSWMLMSGESDWKVAQHVGHKNTQMIQKVYGHFIPKTEPKWSLDDPSVF